jgi:hypothetical protein
MRVMPLGQEADSRPLKIEPTFFLLYSMFSLAAFFMHCPLRLPAVISVVPLGHFPFDFPTNLLPVFTDIEGLDPLEEDLPEDPPEDPPM